MPFHPRLPLAQIVCSVVLAVAGTSVFSQGVDSNTLGASGRPPAILASSLNAQDMFLNATPMVKLVMLMLLLASLVSWATLIATLRELRQSRRSLKHSHMMLQMAPSLACVQNVNNRSVLALLDRAGAEVERSAHLISEGMHEGVRKRMASGLQREEEAWSRKLGRGLPILASIGSVSPFVGLFGTVWGIMHSFIDIAHTNTTNLAVVAPGIAEALLATAFGLGAAIPATLMYNALGRRITSSRALLGDCVTEILCVASRDSDHLFLARVNAARIPDGPGLGTPRIVSTHAG